VIVLMLAGLLFAHDATWSIVIGLVLILGGLFAFVISVDTAGSWRGLAAGGAAIAIGIGTAAWTSAGWLSLVGRDATATVTHVSTYCVGRTICNHRTNYTLRLDDGDEVAGPLRDYSPGSFHLGERVAVRYDPTGLLRFPRAKSDSRNDHDFYGGLLAVVVGLGAAVFLVLPRRRTAPAETTPDPI
jgi:hypothetical protein